MKKLRQTNRKKAIQSMRTLRPGTKNFTYVVRNGEIFFCEKDKLIPQPYTGMKAERIKGLCEIRTALLEVINIQSHEYDPVDLQKVQDTLNQVYDRFVAKYDEPSTAKETSSLLSDDDQFPLLRSIEDERKDKTGWDKSAIFTKATIRPFRQVNHADTAEDALANLPEITSCGWICPICPS